VGSGGKTGWLQGRLAARVGYLVAHGPHMAIGAAIVLGFPHLVAASEYGGFAVGFAFVNIAGAIFYGWLQLSLVRLAGGTDSLVPPHLSTVLLATLLPLLPCIAAAWLLSRLGFIGPWLPAAVAAGGFNAATSMGQMARGLHRPKLYGAVGAARFILVLGLALAFTRASATQSALLYAVGCGSFGAAVLAIIGSIKTLRPDGRKAQSGPAISVRALLAYGVPASLSLIAIMIMLNGDRFLLGWLYDPSVVAAFSAQSGAARQIIYPVISALGISVVPNALLVRKRASEEAAINSVATESAQILAITSPVVAIAVAFGSILAGIALPSAYREGAAWVIPVSTMAAYLMGCRLVRYDPVFHVLLRPRAIAKCAATALVVWAIALYPLTAAFGPVGTAGAGLLAALAANLVAAVLIGKANIRFQVIPVFALYTLVVCGVVATGARLWMNGHALLGATLILCAACYSFTLLLLRRCARGASS